MRILITAGPTREYIDPVRFISNDSSGRMGLALTAAALQRGHSVTLVHGPLSRRTPPRVAAQSVVSAQDMLAACLAAWPQHDLLIMAAAVADFRPARRHARKIKHSRGMPALALRRNPDILQTLARRKRPDQRLIGFALEDADGRARAEEKLRRKRLDAIVLNSPAAISADRAQMEVLVRGAAWLTLSLRSKRAQAVALVQLAEGLFRA